MISLSVAASARWSRLRLAWWPAFIAMALILVMPVVPRGNTPADLTIQAPICSADGSGHAGPATPNDAGDKTSHHLDRACWFCVAHPGWLPAVSLAFPPTSLLVAVATVFATIEERRPPHDFLVGRRTRAPPTRPC